MNRILRRSPWWQGVALLALVSVLSGTWLTVVHGGLLEGGACPAASGPPPPRHGFTVGHDEGAPAHHDCQVCHWLRSLRSMTGDAATVLAGIAPAGFVLPDLIDREGHLPFVALPARSPPA
jgi:hypothetical protein